MPDAFISYSRKDKDFVKGLNEALLKNKFTTWIDWEDIPHTSKWWEEIKLGIEQSDNFIFVISPNSVASKYCKDEAEYAIKHRKRLAPILHRDGFDENLMLSALRDTHWLKFQPDDHFDQAVQTLVKALNTDLDYVKFHTQLLVKAIEWNREMRDESLLLRGKSLQQAEQWLAASQELEPKPSGRHREYIRASQARQKAQNLLYLFGAFGALAAVIGSSIGFFSWRIAREGSKLEQQGAFLLSAIRELDFHTELDFYTELDPVPSSKSVQDTASTELIPFLVEALKIGNDLDQILFKNSFWLKDYPATSPLIVLQEILNRLEQNVTSNEEIHRCQRLITRFPNEQITNISFSADSQYLALSNSELSEPEGKLFIYNCAADQNSIQEVPIGNIIVDKLEFSPDGKYILILDIIGTLRVWNRDSNTLSEIESIESFFIDFTLNQDGSLLATRDHKNVKVWRWTWSDLTLEQPEELPLDRAGDGIITSMFFSSEDHLLFTINDWLGSVQHWNISSQEISRLFYIYESNIRQVALSPDGKEAAFLTSNFGDSGDIIVWDLDGQQLNQFKELDQAGAYALGVSFSPDSQSLAVVYNNGKVIRQPLKNLKELLSRGCEWLEANQNDYTDTITLDEIKDVCEHRLG